MKRLSPKQSQLVAENADLAFWLAAPVSRRFPRIRDEIQSAAMWGLVRAAARFRPSRKVKFSTFATPRIKGEIAHAIRTAAGSRRLTPVVVGRLPVSPDCGWEVDLPAPGRGVGWKAESDDSVDALTRPLPDDLRGPARLYFLNPEITLKQVGRRFGVSESAACLRIGKALELMRLALVARPPRTER